MDESRKRLDNGTDKNVIIPSPEPLSHMDEAYIEFIERLKRDIARQRVSISLRASADVICQYWYIGNAILEQQRLHGWGAKVIDRISFDLRKAFPDTEGFSPRNLKDMRRFAKVWPDFEFVRQLVAQIPWGTNIALMQKLKSQEQRIWYAQKTIENGWGRNTLVEHIRKNDWERSGKAVNNFDTSSPSPDSDLAAQTFKDPYWFDFMGKTRLQREREVEQKLIEHIQEFLIELGQGFAFVGRQVHLELGGEDYYLDLLFYHLKLRCFVVVELKARDFEPGFLGQLNMYQNVVNAVLRHPDDKPTIGLLLVRGKNETTVRYSLEGYLNPIGVAEWQQQLEQALPASIAADLPTIEDIERELEEGGEE